MKEEQATQDERRKHEKRRIIKSIAFGELKQLIFIR